MIKTILGITCMWKNTALGAELACYFFAKIGPLELDVVLDNVLVALWLILLKMFSSCLSCQIIVCCPYTSSSVLNSSHFGYPHWYQTFQGLVWSQSQSFEYPSKKMYDLLLSIAHFFFQRYTHNMKTIIALSLAVASLCVSTVLGYPSYGGLIPNGRSVPSPCPAGGTWGGVGHNLQYGTGPLNPFGVVSTIFIYQTPAAMDRSYCKR